LRHCSDPGYRMDFAVFGPDEDRRLTPKSEMGKFDDRPGEHRGNTSVHRVSTFEIETHARFGSGVAASGDRSVRPTYGVADGPLKLLSLAESRDRPAGDHRESAERVSG